MNKSTGLYQAIDPDDRDTFELILLGEEWKPNAEHFRRTRGEEINVVRIMNGLSQEATYELLACIDTIMLAWLPESNCKLHQQSGERVVAHR